MAHTGAPRPSVVLVVDDEPLVRELAAEFFTDAGFEVLEAQNGAQALEVLRARPEVDAIFTDVQMPGEPDGLALAKTVREICPTCAIVVASGRVAPKPEQLAENALFLTKPYNFEQAVGAVDAILQRRG